MDTHTQKSKEKGRDDDENQLHKRRNAGTRRMGEDKNGKIKRCKRKRTGQKDKEG